MTCAPDSYSSLYPLLPRSPPSFPLTTHPSHVVEVLYVCIIMQGLGGFAPGSISINTESMHSICLLDVETALRGVKKFSVLGKIYVFIHR